LITEKGDAIVDLYRIKGLTPAYYEKLFNQNIYWNVFPEVIVKKKLTPDVSHWTGKDISPLKIKTALFQMQPDKTPGPDGFNS